MSSCDFRYDKSRSIDIDFEYQVGRLKDKYILRVSKNGMVTYYPISKREYDTFQFWYDIDYEIIMSRPPLCIS